MNDLISRKKLLNEINAYVVGSQDKEFICKLIKEAPSAQQWIPCSERMPESYDRVFCFQPKGIVKVMWIGYFDNTIGVWVTDDGWEQYTNPVTAWMPLPEPYKEGDE